jgi:predicted GNAT family acetyltransferase
LRVQWSQAVDRMSLAPPAFVPSPDEASTERLDDRHEAEIRELYEDGRQTGEEPDFFMRSQLQDGTFYGLRIEGRLIAAGGTHLYSGIESVGAIGNVYTHREHRGRGYGAAVTSAVVRELIRRSTGTIALNVRSKNDRAKRVYQRLGFRFHTRFIEGHAGPSRQ